VLVMAWEPMRVLFVGLSVGSFVGEGVGFKVGFGVGLSVGSFVGDCVGILGWYGDAAQRGLGCRTVSRGPLLVMQLES
jgi:hypothetical protein